MARKDASPLPLAALLTLALSLGVFLLAGGGSARSTNSVRPGLEKIALEQLAFEPAAGGFVARGPHYAVRTSSTGWSVVAGGKALRTRIVGAHDSSGRGVERLPGHVNYIVGDKSRWRTGVPTFGQVRYRGIYPGTDLLYHGKHGQLEYDFMLAPRADPGRIQLRLGGQPTLDRNG